MSLTHRALVKPVRRMSKPLGAGRRPGPAV
jgi:hypothetical protein